MQGADDVQGANLLVSDITIQSPPWGGWTLGEEGTIIILSSLE